MNFDEHLRDEATKYHELAEQTVDPEMTKEFLVLASICDEVANDIEDRMTAGSILKAYASRFSPL